MGFDAAVARIASMERSGASPLHQELMRMHLEVRAGRPREEAMRDFGERTGSAEVKRVVTAFTQAERLGQLEVLPPVRNQWNFVAAIARKYGVTIDILGNSPRDNMYNGPLAAWHGELKGSVTAALVAAMEIQKAVPTYLYTFSANGGNATIAFSVLGSE